MTWKLFIDDEREPIGDDWKVARSWYDVGNLLYEHGMPNFISFDHDLGENKVTGYDIAKYLCLMDMNRHKDDQFGRRYPFPEDFDFYVHSQNPVGKENIEKYMNSYLNLRKKGLT